jgi:hypothetical protein
MANEPINLAVRSRDITRKSTRTRNSWLRFASLHILANHYLACYLGVITQNRGQS